MQPVGLTPQEESKSPVVIEVWCIIRRLGRAQALHVGPKVARLNFAMVDIDVPATENLTHACERIICWMQQERLDILDNAISNL